MKRLRVITLLVLLGFIATLLTGCVNPEAAGRMSTDDEYFGKKHYVVPISMSPQNLNEEASDSENSRNSRCQHAFYLFGAYNRPGYSSRQVGDVMRGAKWLDETRIGLSEDLVAGCRSLPAATTKCSSS